MLAQVQAQTAEQWFIKEALKEEEKDQSDTSNE
jgi:hypothetical protein